MLLNSEKLQRRKRNQFIFCSEHLIFYHHLPLFYLSSQSKKLLNPFILVADVS